MKKINSLAKTLPNAKIDVIYRKNPITARSGRGDGDGVLGIYKFIILNNFNFSSHFQSKISIQIQKKFISPIF
jgi:hypothetical protein